MMALYSFALLLGLALTSPWWLLRMATTARYREGLAQRLGCVPAALRAFVRGRRVVWVHAVSVGEALAASRLVVELEAALGDGWCVVISTTTRTGQALARKRFGEERVFYMPLDFAFAVRAYLRALRPAAVVLMESEVWPRLLQECVRAQAPVVVVNARVSDRSFARAMKLRALWSPVLRWPALWLAQSEQDGQRLVEIGAPPERVRVIGNVKYDVRAPQQSRLPGLIRELAGGRPLVVAGSLGDRRSSRELSEDEMVIQAWEGALRQQRHALLVLAPRHPERFDEVYAVSLRFSVQRATELLAGEAAPVAPEIVLLDTIGDLAAVYEVADVAFVGGSLVGRGGHNPLEPAQFGVPVVIGPSYENFRGIVGEMLAAQALRIVLNQEQLAAALMELVEDRAAAQALGQRGREVFTAQRGATQRAVQAVVALLQPAGVGA